MALVGVILLQRSEGGALGGLGGGTFGGLMTARGTANLLTRTTAILAACFIATSLALAILAGHGRARRSILDRRPGRRRRRAGSRLGHRPRSTPRGSRQRRSRSQPAADRSDRLRLLAGAASIHWAAMKRFVFITGGVVSSLGKGLAAAALGSLLQLRGYRVRLRKLDPYLNVDPGHDVALSARRGVRHRRRGGDRPRPRPL